MIQLERLRKEYDAVVAVEDLSLTIAEGEIFGLIGPNGAGKTTTMRMACGLLAPTQGRAVVCGVDVEAEPERAQQYIGYLADYVAVYEDLRVWEYLDFFAAAYDIPKTESGTRIREVLSEIGLLEKADAMIQTLSRGMKQRLGIARAVIHRPKILILDEPAAGLDPDGRIELRELLTHFRDEGSTILISSHVLAELEGFCTSIGIMERGRLARTESLREPSPSAARTRTIEIAWTMEPPPSLAASLQSVPGVSDIVLQHHRGEFRFDGSHAELSRVLDVLTDARIGLHRFAETRQTIEERYLEISRSSRKP